MELYIRIIIRLEINLIGISDTFKGFTLSFSVARAKQLISIIPFNVEIIWNGT
jgi:hypothetical protein